MRLDRLFAALAACLCAGALHAQLTPQHDWKETEAPAPPALQTQRLVPLDMNHSSLRWGIDPASIRVGEDGIVRYVVVAQGEGSTLNAIYEGVRCTTGEVKVYARHLDGRWVPPSTVEWKTLFNAPATRHSLLIARNGACRGTAPELDPQRIARDLRSVSGRAFYQTP